MHPDTIFLLETSQHGTQIAASKTMVFIIYIANDLCLFHKLYLLFCFSSSSSIPHYTSWMCLLMLFLAVPYIFIALDIYNSWSWFFIWWDLESSWKDTSKLVREGIFKDTKPQYVHFLMVGSERGSWKNNAHLSACTSFWVTVFNTAAVILCRCPDSSSFSVQHVLTISDSPGIVQAFANRLWMLLHSNCGWCSDQLLSLQF